MNDINRKQMKDVIIPVNDIIRRAGNLPETSPHISTQKEEADRIDKNPFFKKEPQKHSSSIQEEKPRSKALLWAIVFAALLAGAFLVANYFASATVEVVPVSRSAVLDTDFVAVKEGSTDASTELSFKFVSLNEEQSKEVPATIEKKIQKKASGKVVIFNAYNGEKQRLIKNTRLESPDHKIFRIDESVVVPGATIVNGKVTTPGSVEAIVYADVPGKEYNLKLLDGDFTVPGFKGDPRYAKFYGRMSDKAPISGGFSGSVKVPSDEAVLSAQEEIKIDLKKIAVEKVRAQIPPDVSFFPGSMIVKFEEVPQDFTADATAKVTVRATISVFFFDTAELTQKIADAVIPADKGKTFSLPDMSVLTFTFVDPVDNIVLADIPQVKFHLTGTAGFVGKIDTNKIRKALAGRDKKDFGKIINEQSNIDKTNLVIRPIWKTTFPFDSSKITVKIGAK